MKFGIFYELQLPRPWTPEGEFRLYQNALDQVEVADRLGYDFAWEVEHHFLVNIRTRRPPKSFSPRRASAQSKSASRTASCS